MPHYHTLSVTIASEAGTLEGDLVAPADARGMVVFAHGSGSSRYSPRNRRVAGVLQQAGFATLLFDLLTAQEEAEDRQTMRLRFDISMLAGRLSTVTRWLLNEAPTRGLPLAYFGASTGAAAALVAAAQQPGAIRAIVSRGGRPDMAGNSLPHVAAPTLLIVGGNDPTVIAMNRVAMALLRPDRSLRIVPGATHLFEEPGALEEVGRLACAWFERYLVSPTGEARGEMKRGIEEAARPRGPYTSR